MGNRAYRVDDPALQEVCRAYFREAEACRKARQSIADEIGAVVVYVCGCVGHWGYHEVSGSLGFREGSIPRGWRMEYINSDGLVVCDADNRNGTASKTIKRLQAVPAPDLFEVMRVLGHPGEVRNPHTGMIYWASLVRFTHPEEIFIALFPHGIDADGNLMPTKFAGLTEITLGTYRRLSQANNTLAARDPQ